ncbi:MAG: preprotein translocase subunit SecA [Spirochaetales bacterium]|nr:preprotein translocase subunit SecA [Spirochaetales bacterium]
MLDKILSVFLGSKFDKDLKMLVPLVKKINALESAMRTLSPEDVKAKTAEYRERIAKGESLEKMLPEAFALAREAAHRVLGERLFDVQLMGGIVLHQGKIMEMKTGEGKTLSSVPAAYLNALSGKGVHIATVNDYLAERDSQWMGPVYEYLGVSVGVILPNLDQARKKDAYAKDITYGTNNEFGFDYLRDNMVVPGYGTRVQREFNYCIIDEIDSILIDEARTPLIISGPAEDDTGKYFEINKLIAELTECAKDPATGEYPEENSPVPLVGDYKIEEKNKRISFTDQGMNKIEEILKRRGIITDSLFSDENFEYIHYFTQLLRAHKLFHIDVDYVINEGKVEIVDEFTGRILHGRRYSDGLHQAIEAKERIKIASRNVTLATITFQNYFKLYKKFGGMTGTADTEAREFAKIYNLDVVVVPTNRPVNRTDEDDLIFLNASDKYNAICDQIAELHQKGQPVLVGTVSVEKSEVISNLLKNRGLRHEVLNAKNHAREALIIAEAGARGAVTVATNMAGRGTDIKLGGNPEFRARKKAGTDASQERYREVLAEEYEKWRADYNEVKAAGGLFVLGTERHEARRIDNQLRGRSGRQGDPGTSRFYISLDDELMRLFGGDNLKNVMQRFGFKGGEPLYHPIINRSIERAQKRVEERNYEMRKHLLEYDDVLNEQRNYMYGKRDEILKDGALYIRVLETAGEIVDGLVEEYSLRKDRSLSPIKNLIAQLRTDFLYVPSVSAEELAAFNPEQLKKFIKREFENDIREKENLIGKENLNTFVRFEYINNIDSRWQSHLDALDSLKEAVGLRSYGQKNPLLEYKLEGFQIFDEMLAGIRNEVAKKVLKVKIRVSEEQPAVPRPVRVPARRGEASHTEIGQFGAMGGAPQAAPSAAPQRAAASPVATVQRSVPKVGRNDPCPCGSGKKYKKCHGA